MVESSEQAPRVPTSAHFYLVQDAPDRLVVHIPGGGPRTTGLGCFALGVNGLMLVVTLVSTLIALQAEATPWWFIVPVLALFWLVGLVLAWFWVRMRFTRVNVLVQPERVVVEKAFFDRRAMEETGIDAESTVELAEMYRVNEQPVHAIAVSGSDRTIKFGTSLSDQDKRFLVRKIRLVARLDERTEEEWLRFVRDFPGNCVTCGATLPAPQRYAAFVTCEHCGRVHAGSVAPAAEEAEEDSLVFDDLEPSQLPPDSLIEVAGPDPARLELRYPAFGPRGRWLAAGCLAFLSLFVSVALGIAFFVFGGLAGLPLPWDIAGGLLLGVGIPAVVFVAVGRSTAKVVLDRQQLQGTWKTGPLRIKRAMPLPEIRQVLLTRTPDGPADRQDREGTAGAQRRTARGANEVTCVVVSTSRRIPVTSDHSLATCRELAGLIRGRLRKLGCEV
jgi:hypothetical protein